MGKGMRVKNDLSIILNTETSIDYMNYLKLLAMSVFEWTGMPDSINTRFIERMLFETGKCLFFKDKYKGLNFLAVGCTPSDRKNVYDEYTSYTTSAPMYSGYKYMASECVFIRNNADMVPSSIMTMLYARRLYEATRTMDVNIQQQKTSRVLTVSNDAQKLTLENIIMQTEENRPAILIDKSLPGDSLKSIDMRSEYVCDKIMDYKTDVFNEFMSRLGMNNANTDKKERLITDEVQANNQLIQLSLETMLIPRQTAAAEINRKWPELHVTCQLRKSLQAASPIEPAADPESEGSKNE